MVEHITRQFVFDNYQAITSVIIDIQKAMFESDALFEDGDDGKWYNEMHDAINISFKDVKKYYNTISFDHSDINTFTNVLSDKLIKLLTKLDVSDLIIISHKKLNFIGNPNNKYNPFQKAIKKFKDVTQNLQYDEAFRVNLVDLPTLIEIAFWIERCDAGAPEYIYFSDVNEKLAFYICKLGGIHLIQYNQEIVFDELVESLGMHFVNQNCEEKFSADSKIEGRRGRTNP